MVHRTRRMYFAASGENGSAAAGLYFGSEALLSPANQWRPVLWPAQGRQRVVCHAMSVVNGIRYVRAALCLAVVLTALPGWAARKLALSQATGGVAMGGADPNYTFGCGNR